MAGSKNSKPSRRSNPAAASGLADHLAAPACFLAAAAIMAVAVWYFFTTGATLYWGDAEAHLDIARRIVDSRTPGWSEIGTTWLPLPHLLMLPLVGNDRMWQTGLAGAIPAAICTALGATFLFAAVRRLFDSNVAASAAAAVYLLNPNTLYLGSIPMTEAVFFASLFAVFFFTVRFAQTQGWGALAGTGLAAFAGTLTRYEAWFLLPFLALYIALKGGPNRWIKAVVFCLIAGLGPMIWLAHNYWYYRDALYFYRGPWSAKALQGNLPYPGKGDWQTAIRYFFAAGRHIVGTTGLALFGIGAVLTLAKREWWPVLLLSLSPFFYIWGIHSQGNPIFVPELTPHGWYNTRYAMALLPLTALGAAALSRFGKAAAAAAAVIALAPFLYPFDSHSISWQEAEHNSHPYLEMTRQATDYLRAHAGPNETYFTSYGVTSIYRTLGIHFADTLSGDNSPQYFMAINRPDIFLHEDWAITTSGDQVQTVIDKARLRGPRYELQLRITVKGTPVVEIYRRTYDIPVR
jgi:hypothetical protein